VSDWELVTRGSLVADLAALALPRGGVLLVHSSLRSLGWVVGGAAGVVQALRVSLGSEGTLVVPTHTSQQLDPLCWMRPAVPADRVDEVREAMLPFDPATTPSLRRGVVAEYVRTHPGACRSNHPTASFAAIGPAAEEIVGGHFPGTRFGRHSPLGRCYDLAARVLLLGVGHESNTSLHLAEHFAAWPSKKTEELRMKALVDGRAVWVEHDDLAADSRDFAAVGAAFEASTRAPLASIGSVGGTSARLLDMRSLVEFAADYMSTHRR
jgi:aminoglycoside 3-N-acetyltransferase